MNFMEDPVDMKSCIGSRLEKNGIQKIILQISTNISPSQYAKLLRCLPTTAEIERFFSMTKNILKFDRIFDDLNIKIFTMQKFKDLTNFSIS